MLVRSKLTNPTETKQKYGFIPKHGIILGAKQTHTMDGDIYTITPAKRRCELNSAITSGRLKIVLETDATIERLKAVKEKVAKEVTGETVKEIVEEKIEETVEETIEEEVLKEGITSADAETGFDDGPIFDVNGNEIIEEEPLDAMDALREGDQDLIGAIATSEDKTNIPSKTAMKGMSVEEIAKIAEANGVDINKITSKKARIAALVK